jgi:hypothetical protein
MLSCQQADQKEGMEGHDFVHAKHETLHFLLLSINQGILIDIVGHNPFLTMDATKKGGPHWILN